jgi:hypothetical protein
MDIAKARQIVGNVEQRERDYDEAKERLRLAQLEEDERVRGEQRERGELALREEAEDMLAALKAAMDALSRVRSARDGLEGALARCCSAPDLVRRLAGSVVMARQRLARLGGEEPAVRAVADDNDRFHVGSIGRSE